MLLAAALSGLVALAAAQTNATNPADTVTVCNLLYAEYPEYFAWDPLGPYGLETLANASVYTDINQIYWNVANSNLRAACAFFPGTAEQVSFAVTTLNEYPAVNFALKSGGHQPAVGFSATDGGVIISFEPNLASTVRSDDGEHFIVGVGARWGDVYTVAGETNQVVVGGRLGHIGVAGLTLGGGLSYYSAQYGFACDNVDNFEVVLANGTIANANRTSHPDLWAALRGGGNQFAIVTKIHTQAHPMGVDGLIWGGVRTYDAQYVPQLLRAVTNFVREYPDAKAAIIPTFQFALPGDLVELPLLFFFYDGPSPPAGVFDEFDAIPSLTNDTEAKTMYTLSQEEGGASTTGLGNSFRMNTVPNLPEDDMVEYLSYYYNRTASQANNDSLTNLLDIQVMGFDPQPVSVVIQQASAAQGGNMLGLNPDNGDRIFIENDFLWVNQLCDNVCPTYSEEVSEELLAYQKATYPGVPPTNYVSGNVSFSNYNPIFMNDAAPNQDVYTSYNSTNLAKLQAVKAAYDPTGFFTNRQGGFKLP